MSDTPEGVLYDASYVESDLRPQCRCACHNDELANASANISFAGDFRLGSDVELWRDNPRFVDRREPVHAVLACTACTPLHTLAFADDPTAAWRAEQHGTTPTAPAPKPALGGPQGRCDPNCPFCKRHDSIFDEHKK